MPLSYTAKQVKTYDHDRYLWALFFPPGQREALFTILAFNIEIARIAETVSEEMIGLIRIKWWQEALDEIYGDKPIRKHEIAEALAEAIKQYNVPREPFDQLLQARQQDIADSVLPDEISFERYLMDTNAPLFSLAGHIVKQEVQDIEKLALAWGLVGTLRSLPYQSVRDICILPEQWLQMFQVSSEDIIQQKPSDELGKLVSYLLEKVDESELNDHSMYAPLRIMISHFSKRIRCYEYNPFDPRIEKGRGLLKLKLLVAR